MNTLELDTRLNAMIIAGKSVEALGTFYAEDVVAQENDDAERVGRDSWIQSRQQMEKATTTFSARVLANAANGDVSFSEWEYNIELQGMGQMHIIQVAVRRWKTARLFVSGSTTNRAGSTIMNLKWCSVFAIAALAACTAPGTPELDAVDGFWIGTVPQGLLQLHVLEINRDLEGFGIIQATSGEIAVTMLGDRDGGGVNMTLTKNPGTTTYATFAGELDGDSLVGSWSSPPGTTPSTVRLGR